MRAMTLKTVPPTMLFIYLFSLILNRNKFSSQPSGTLRIVSDTKVGVSVTIKTTTCGSSAKFVWPFILKPEVLFQLLLPSEVGGEAIPAIRPRWPTGLRRTICFRPTRGRSWLMQTWKLRPISRRPLTRPACATAVLTWESLFLTHFRTCAAVALVWN